jgi:hypothetical protein
MWRLVRRGHHVRRRHAPNGVEPVLTSRGITLIQRNRRVITDRRVNTVFRSAWLCRWVTSIPLLRSRRNPSARLQLRCDERRSTSETHCVTQAFDECGEQARWLAGWDSRLEHEWRPIRADYTQEWTAGSCLCIMARRSQADPPLHLLAHKSRFQRDWERRLFQPRRTGSRRRGRVSFRPGR